MKMFKGKVKSIVVKESNICLGGPYILFFDGVTILGDINKIGLDIVNIKSNGLNFGATKSELRTLVVEYEEQTERGGIYFKNGYGLIKFKEIDIKQLPLKYSQWQLAIDNGEVDTEKEIGIEIIDSESLNTKIKLAQIIRKAKRQYSEDEVRVLLSEVGELYRNEFTYGSPAFEEWFKTK